MLMQFNVGVQQIANELVENFTYLSSIVSDYSMSKLLFQ